MSKEEKQAIEVLKEYSEKDVPCDSCRYCSEKPNVTKSVREIINLIEKQQKEIEYLKSQIPQDKIFYYSENDFISKDKIREKIKELECIEPSDDDYNFELQNDIHSKIDVLKQLIGDEDGI